MGKTIENLLAVSLIGLAALVTGCDANNTVANEKVNEKVKKVEVPKKSGRFTDRQLETFRESGVPEEVAYKYDNRFGHSASEIIEAWQTGLTPEKALQYNARFSADSILELHNAGVSPEMAKRYDKRFDERQHHDRYPIWKAFKEGLLPEIANSYKEDFSLKSILVLHNVGITAKVANEYDNRFKAGDIINAVKAALTPEASKQYEGCDSGSLIVQLHLAGVTPELFQKYDSIRIEKFGRWYRHQENILDLAKAEISPEEFAAFDNSLYNTGNSRDACAAICAMHQAGVTASQANRFAELNKKHGSLINGHDIAYFAREKIPFEVVEARVKSLMLDERITK